MPDTIHARPLTYYRAFRRVYQSPFVQRECPFTFAASADVQRTAAFIAKMEAKTMDEWRRKDRRLTVDWDHEKREPSRAQRFFEALAGIGFVWLLTSAILAMCGYGR